MGKVTRWFFLEVVGSTQNFFQNMQSIWKVTSLAPFVRIYHNPPWIFFLSKDGLSHAGYFLSCLNVPVTRWPPLDHATELQQAPLQLLYNQSCNPRTAGHSGQPFHSQLEGQELGLLEGHCPQCLWGTRKLWLLISGSSHGFLPSPPPTMFDQRDNIPYGHKVKFSKLFQTFLN